MIIDINYKNGNLAGARIYCPEEDSNILMVWAGGGWLFRWDLESLGKHIAKGEIKPKCYVLMPYCKNRKSLAEVSTEDMRKCIFAAFREIGHEVSLYLCGYSMGSNAVQQWLNGGMSCGKFVLISNFPTGWYKRKTVPLDVPMRAYYGGSEHSRVQDWQGMCELFTEGECFSVGRLVHGQMARRFWLTEEGKDCLEWLEEEI